MCDDDWRRLITHAREHRMGPMLHYRDKQAGQNWPLPAFVRESWTAGYRRSAMRALEFERALHHISAVMAAAEIPFIALKGSWLAWHAYPHPALRPMRDIDLWIPQNRAMAARAALIDAGATAVSVGYESVESLVGDAKTLPPLVSAVGGITIELHQHLSQHHHADSPEGIDAEDQGDLLGGAVGGQLRGHPIGYLAPTDTLLHLVVHSAFDHGFNNGPAIFDDIAFILANHAIDWQRFWMRADSQNWTKGALLVLALTIRQHGPQPVEWQGRSAEMVPDAILDAVLPLTLQSAQDRSTIAFLASMETEKVSSGLSRYLRRLLVPQKRLAMYFGVASDNPLAWLAYPLWLVSGAWRIARGRLDREVRQSGGHMALLADWIDASSQSRRR
jgi:Uncharacterised nucleotidyltransferase